MIATSVPLRRSGDGAVFSLARLAYKAAQRAIVLDVTRLLWLEASAVRLPPASRGSVQFDFLSPTAVDCLAIDPVNEFESGLAARIDGEKNFCFAATINEALAAYIWLARESIEAEHNRGGHPRSGVGLSFPHDTAFVYKAFTRPEHRGKRLYARCMGEALRALAPRGVRNLLTTADWTNRAARESCRRLGFEDLGAIWRFGVGSRMFTTAPKRARELGVLFDRKNRVERNGQPNGHAPLA